MVEYFSLAVKENASDNPRWQKAMNGPDRDGDLEEMKMEI